MYLCKTFVKHVNGKLVFASLLMQMRRKRRKNEEVLQYEDENAMTMTTV